MPALAMSPATAVLRAAAVGRAARRRPALSVTLAAVGAGAVVVTAFGTAFGSAPEPPEFRTPPAAAPQPSAATKPAAAHSGLAPYEPPVPASAPRTGRGTRTGMSAGPSEAPSPTPSSGSSGPTMAPGTSAAPAAATPAGTTRSATGALSSGTPEKAASISIGQPGDGETVAANASVSGEADLPDGHQIWLLWRHGAGAHHVAAACRAGRTFSCGPAGLESGGDDTFTLTAIVVDPPTGRTLDEGQSLDTLPAHVARSEITVRRAAA